MRSGRPVADAMTPLPLPEKGMQVSLPKVTGGVTVTMFADNGVVSNTDVTSGSLTFSVTTIAGEESMARQLRDRGPALDALIFGDLLAAYNGQLDAQVINGSGAAPQVKGLLQATGAQPVTFNAPMSPPALVDKIANALDLLTATRKQMPTAVFMHTRRWAYLCSQSSTTNQPLAFPPPARLSPALERVAPENIVGTICGLPVIVTPNMPTTLGGTANLDAVLVVRTQDCPLYEAPIEFRVIEDHALSGNLALKLQASAFVAFTPERVANGAVAAITGSAFTPPTY